MLNMQMLNGIAAFTASSAAHIGTQKEGLEKDGLIYRNKDGSYGYAQKLIRGYIDKDGTYRVDVMLARDQVPKSAFITGCYHLGEVYE